ncbi:hypothetical protein GCM10027184_14120 [Saccharothrix stipae]
MPAAADAGDIARTALVEVATANAATTAEIRRAADRFTSSPASSKDGNGGRWAFPGAHLRTTRFNSVNNDGERSRGALRNIVEQAIKFTVMNDCVLRGSRK